MPESPLDGYASITLNVASAADVAGALTRLRREGFVIGAAGGDVVVIDRRSGEGDVAALVELAGALSAELSCPALAVMNQDNAILFYHLYVDGRLTDQYDSTPDYFDSADAPSLGPRGGSVPALLEAFGECSAERLGAVLRAPALESGGYLHALERHRDLAGALGLPEVSAGISFDDLLRDLQVVAAAYPDGTFQHVRPASPDAGEEPPLLQK